MAQDDSVQQKFQDILSHVEEVGLPEGEYLKVCNALRDIFKQVPEDKGSKYRNKMVQNIPLPDNLPILHLCDSLHMSDRYSITLTLEKMERYFYEERWYNGEYHKTSSTAYHFNLEGCHERRSKITYHTGLGKVVSDDQLRQIFLPFEPKLIRFVVNGITHDYDVKTYIRCMKKEIKEDYEDYKQDVAEDEEVMDFEEWCEERDVDYDIVNTDAYHSILWSALQHVERSLSIKNSEQYQFVTA